MYINIVFRRSVKLIVACKSLVWIVAIGSMSYVYVSKGRASRMGAPV